MEHLIANSGIQFISQEIEFNPSEPFILKSGKILKYSFCEMTDFLTENIVFDLLYYHNDHQVYIPLKELGARDKFEKLPNGRECIDETGMPSMLKTEAITFYTTLPNEDPDTHIISINSLDAFRVEKSVQSHEKVSAFDLLLDKWLPMPLFEKEIDDITNFYPLGWCRLKIQEISKGQNMNRYRMIWAIDTTLSSNGLSTIRPYFYETDSDTKEYSICNKTDLLFNFLFCEDMDEKGNVEPKVSAIAEYIANIWGLQLDKISVEKYKFIAYYIYFINFIRLHNSPQIVLHHKPKNVVDVDLVLDIGNSRTCGVLFEDGDFTRAVMLELRDLSSPWKTYDKPFDMRVVFRRSDFGNDIAMDEEEDLFNWKSLVRIGEEAQKLIYQSLEEDGLSERTTNYSSPKRYLWDTKKFDGKWEFLISTDDPLNVKVIDSVFVKNLTNWLDDKGNYIGKENIYSSEKCQYSRSSLMTFVFIEIFQHAFVQINSTKFRTKHGRIDCPRRLRNVIITAPTAMPNVEQVRLRKSAMDAYEILMKSDSKLIPITVSPLPTSIDDWSYDEASASQLVYLYAEIAQRYSGEIHRFIEAKGHIRPELTAKGYNHKALTIGSIDIGAGTTDLMICAYEYEGQGCSRLTPIPLFWDSFYLAGDDILKNVVQRIIIDGPMLGNSTMGSIHSVLQTRMLSMTNEQLQQLSSINFTPAYTSLMGNILNAIDITNRELYIKRYASNLIHDYFGTDSSNQSYKGRRCRVDFNTQISMPIAQMMLNLLRLNRPSKVYTYDELFLENKPSSYLLDHFAIHFGFRFEEIEWRFEPENVAAQVRSTMEPLMKQLSIILHAYNIDILVLAGRPTSLNSITELFIKYYPLSPDRLVRLNEYMVGSWYPFADGEGYFYDQKSVVAVGAMVGYLASHQGFNGLVIDFEKMIKKMTSTANYMGLFNSERQQVDKSFLMPKKSSATQAFAVFPAFIGCKQLDVSIYQARPIYAIYNHSDKRELRIHFMRDFSVNREELIIVDIYDNSGETVAKDQIELVQQSLVDDGKYWLDKGEFRFL